MRLVKRLRNDAENFADSLVKESMDPGIKTVAISRLITYQPEVHKRPLECPYCWIIDGTKRSLEPTAGPIEAIGCSTCGSEYSLD